MAFPVSPEGEEYAAFLHELYDEEFTEALLELVAEAAELYETRYMHGKADPWGIGHEGERLLERHFAPLAREAEATIEDLAAELDWYWRRDPASLTESEIGMLVDPCQPSLRLGPVLEAFFGKLMKVVKKTVKKAIDLTKKGIGAAARLGLGPILNKLKALIKSLLRKVLQTAARLAFACDPPTTRNVAEIQQEFDVQVAHLLFVLEQ